MLPLREVLTLHLDDDQRSPDERGVQGAVRRLRRRLELQRQLLTRRSRGGEP
jgi:DNA-binding response OmpR family regulator